VVVAASAARAEDTAPAAPAPAAPAETTQPAPASSRAPEPEDVRIRGKAFRDTGGSGQVLSERQLQRFKHEDPHRVLLQVPGVYIRGEDGFGLRPNIGMRGVNPDRSKKVTLMEDGVLFGPAPYSAPAAYFFPSIARMRNVRVLKGPAAIAYGPQTVGGAIDLLTHEVPASLAAVGDVALGNFGYNKFYGRVGTSDEHIGFLVEGLHLGSTGFKDLDRAGNESPADTGFSRNEWMVKGTYTLDPTARVRHEFSVKGSYSDEVSNETYLGLTDADFRASPYRRYRASELDTMKWHRTGVAVSHKVTFSDAFKITTTAYRHDLSRTWNRLQGMRGANIANVLGDPDSPRNRIFYGVLTGTTDTQSAAETLLIGPNQREFVSQGIQTVAELDARTWEIAHHVQYGLRLHYDDVDRVHSQEGYLVRDRRLVRDGQAREITTNELGYTTAFAMHASDAMRFRSLVVTPGLRVELIRSGLQDRLTGVTTTRALQVALPGVGAYYGVTRDFGVLAGVHRGFSPTPAGDRTAQPESTTNYEAGVRYASRKFRGEVIGYYNDYQNFTSVCTFSTNCSEANIDRQIDGGSARIFGGEVLAETDIPVFRSYSIPLRATYTLTVAEFLQDFTAADPQFGQVKRGDEMPYIPIHQASGNAGFEGKYFGVNVGGTYVGDMRERAGQGAPGPRDLTDAYFLLDASAYVRPMPRLTIYANGRNLLNQDYLVSRQPFAARPGAPLTVQLGARFEY
jgi:Fe(3+) dicitrate transport protein